ncbi:MAG: iron-containing alcohol dehydrogenase [Bacteroidales bacterium]|nr:iron-containing alcohol dehydrogenase [Bacteroidales bacterium]
MNNFTFFSPTKFVFGRGVESRTGGLCKQFGGTKVLLVYGGGSVVKSGLLSRVEASLTEAGIKYVEFGGIQPNPIDTKVYEGIELVRKEGIDFILPVGGGSAIDTAKAIAVGVPYNGDFWDFYVGKAKVTSALPVATVLTIPAAGSEGSGDSVITKIDGMNKLGLGSEHMRPKFSIMNPEITMTLPANQTAYGIVDMMAHIFERYFTNTRDVEVTDRVAEGLLIAIINEAKKVMADPMNYEARANIMWSGTIAHNGLCGVGRQEDWMTHCMEHEVSGLNDKVAHGAGLAVIFPAWMTFMAKHNPYKGAQLAERVFGIEAKGTEEERALKGIEKLKEFFVGTLKMPKTLRELGFEAKDIDELVRKFHQNNGETVEGVYYTMTKEVTRAIYEIAL